MSKRIRPECRTCLHRWTFVCSACLRDFYNSSKDGTATINADRNDCWEQEEHKRNDGKFVCDSCGNLSATHDKCDRCDWPFPANWMLLPVAQVPPLGALEDDRYGY